MNLWIRSQDGMNFLKCDVLTIATRRTHYLVTSDNLYHIISRFNSSSYADLGAYQTKERALEILDEIEHQLVILSDSSLNLYQMPKE